MKLFSYLKAMVAQLSLVSFLLMTHLVKYTSTNPEGNAIVSRVNAACLKHLHIDSVLILNDTSPIVMDASAVFGAIQFHYSEDTIIISDHEY